MDRKPVDVMVVNFNTASLLQPMFDALRQADSERLASYLVVDNASADDSLARMAQVCPEALLLSNKQNVGFGRANNQLLAHLQGKYALLLNTDAFVARDTLEKTVAYMDAHPDSGVLGVRLEGREGDLAIPLDGRAPLRDGHREQDGHHHQDHQPAPLRLVHAKYSAILRERPRAVSGPPSP